MSKALTDRTVYNLKTDKAQLDVRDAGCPGLVLRVTKFGKKSWTFIFTSPRDQKRSRITFGTYPATSLEDARLAAVAARKAVEAGTDPRDIIAPEQDRTVAQVVADYVTAIRAKGNRSAAQTESRLNRNVLPVVGKVAMKAFRIPHLNKILDPILEGGAPQEANRNFDIVRSLVSFAVRRGEIEHDPIAKAEHPAPKVVRERFLSRAEVVSMWNGLAVAMDQSVAVQAILKLCLVTAQRLSEVAGMTRSELDLDKNLWTIPATRTKNKREQIVPLSDLALAIIGERLKATTGEYLFPDRTGRAPLKHHVVDSTLARALERGALKMEHWTPHDLRRTAATLMSESGVPEFHISCVLNHISVTRGSITQKVYNRNTYLAEKREALDKWAMILSAIVAGGNVVPMVRAA
jgi:integrase